MTELRHRSVAHVEKVQGFHRRTRLPTGETAEAEGTNELRDGLPVLTEARARSHLAIPAGTPKP